MEDNYRKDYTIDGLGCTLDILDTAGQESYGTMRDVYINSGDGFLCVYSVTSSASVDVLEKQCKGICRVKDVEFDDVSLVIVGNKCDLEKERAVDRNRIETLAAQWQCPQYETSAKTGHNAEHVYFQLVREIRTHRNRPPKPKPDSSSSSKSDLKKPPSKPEKEKKCQVQ